MLPLKPAEDVTEAILGSTQATLQGQTAPPQEVPPPEPLNEDNLLLHYHLVHVIEIAQAIERRFAWSGQGSRLRERYLRDLDAQLRTLAEVATECRALIKLMHGE